VAGGRISLSPRSADANPLDDGYDASYHAKGDNATHGPPKCGGVRNLQYAISKMDGSPADQPVATKTRCENNDEESWLRILKSACHSDGRAERKGRRCEAGNDKNEPRASFHTPFEVNQEFRLDHPFEAFLASLSANKIQQEDADYRSHSCGKRVNRDLGVMSRGQNDQEQIVSEWQEQKGTIRHREEDEAEHAKLKKKVQEMAHRWVSGSVFQAP
jgi:hypothetical protein